MKCLEVFEWENLLERPIVALSRDRLTGLIPHRAPRPALGAYRASPTATSYSIITAELSLKLGEISFCPAIVPYSFFLKHQDVGRV